MPKTYINFDTKEFDKKVEAYMRDEFKSGKRAVLNVYADTAQQLAAEMCPRDTGDLRSTIRKIEVSGREDEVIIVTAGGQVGTGGIGIHSGRQGGKKEVDYALYVHEGTSKMRPRPFLKSGANLAAKMANQSALKEAFLGKKKLKGAVEAL